MLPSPLFKQYLKIFWACMFDLIYSFYSTKQLLHRQEFGQVETNSTHHYFICHPPFPPLYALSLDCGANDLEIMNFSTDSQTLLSSTWTSLHATTWHGNRCPRTHSGGWLRASPLFFLYVHPQTLKYQRLQETAWTYIQYRFLFILLLIKYRERKV